jgi:putative DNA primase/helicase
MIVPAEIATSGRAVVWRAELRGGRRTKVPYAARRPWLHAAVNRPSTWAPFPEALAVVERGGADGVGIVLGDGIAGVDLDHVIAGRDLDHGGRDLEHVAQELVAELASYTEWSPSGAGLHVLVHGTLPPGRRRTAGIELYDGGRFFTVTGQHVPGTPSTIEERTLVLAAVHGRLFPPSTSEMSTRATIGPAVLDDGVLFERIRLAWNGDRFFRLWAGDWCGYPSPSEADLAFCSMLAFWTRGDVARIDRLFRASGLFRPKWDEPRGASTYGERTIAKAVA